jgi:hypothetical protein
MVEPVSGNRGDPVCNPYNPWTNDTAGVIFVVTPIVSPTL